VRDGLFFHHFVIAEGMKILIDAINKIHTVDEVDICAAVGYGGLFGESCHIHKIFRGEGVIPPI